MCSGRTPSMPPAQSRGSTAGPSVPAITAPSGPASSGSRFIGGVPMKRATNVFAGVSYRSTGVPFCSMRPLFSRITRSAIDIASTWSCVTYTIVMPSLRCSARISWRISARSCASRFDSGSSIRHTGASLMIARPSATRCCWPPESCDGLRAEQRREARAGRRRARAARRTPPSAPGARAARTRCSRRPKDAGTARSSGTPSRCCAAPAAAA